MSPLTILLISLLTTAISISISLSLLTLFPPNLKNTTTVFRNTFLRTIRQKTAAVYTLVSTVGIIACKTLPPPTQTQTHHPAAVQLSKPSLLAVYTELLGFLSTTGGITTANFNAFPHRKVTSRPHSRVIRCVRSAGRSGACKREQHVRMGMGSGMGIMRVPTGGVNCAVMCGGGVMGRVIVWGGIACVGILTLGLLFDFGVLGCGLDWMTWTKGIIILSTCLPI